MLRLIYKFMYWYAGDVGIAAGSDIVYGFNRKFRKPADIPKAELLDEIKRLHDAILKAT